MTILIICKPNFRIPQTLYNRLAALDTVKVARERNTIIAQLHPKVKGTDVVIALDSAVLDDEILETLRDFKFKWSSDTRIILGGDLIKDFDFVRLEKALVDLFDWSPKALTNVFVVVDLGSTVVLPEEFPDAIHGLALFVEVVIEQQIIYGNRRFGGCAAVADDINGTWVGLLCEAKGFDDLITWATRKSRMTAQCTW